MNIKVKGLGALVTESIDNALLQKSVRKKAENYCPKCFLTELLASQFLKNIFKKVFKNVPHLPSSLHGGSLLQVDLTLDH